jgi:DtxR family Mn-dependent transcriptional regulator
MASQTEENYLKALFNFCNTEGEVQLSQLSELLKVSKPTANSMVKNLQKKGLVNYERYRPLSLTEKGKKVAALVVRKHRLTEMYLYENMGFTAEEVHEIAEQMEHINAPKLFDKMDELLGFPNFDPHGSPIRDSFGEISE